jgi:hypothetical protein
MPRWRFPRNSAAAVATTDDSSESPAMEEKYHFNPVGRYLEKNAFYRKETNRHQQAFCLLCKFSLFGKPWKGLNLSRSLVDLNFLQIQKKVLGIVTVWIIEVEMV